MRILALTVLVVVGGALALPLPQTGDSGEVEAWTEAATESSTGETITESGTEAESELESATESALGDSEEEVEEEASDSEEGEYPLRLEPQFDTEDIGVYLKDEKLVRRQINCVLFDGPCDAVGRWIKPRVQAALLGECLVCTKIQQNWLDTWLEKLIETFPDVHRAAVAKFVQKAGVELAMEEIAKINATFAAGKFANSVLELEALDDSGDFGGEEKNSIARAIGRAIVEPETVSGSASLPIIASSTTTATVTTTTKPVSSVSGKKILSGTASIISALTEVSNGLAELIKEKEAAATTFTSTKTTSTTTSTTTSKTVEKSTDAEGVTEATTDAIQQDKVVEAEAKEENLPAEKSEDVKTVTEVSESLRSDIDEGATETSVVTQGEEKVMIEVEVKVTDAPENNEDSADEAVVTTTATEIHDDTTIKPRRESLRPNKLNRLPL